MKNSTTQYRWGPEADFLVIGSGIAGLRAAIELCRYGRVLIVTKGSRLESNSMYAQGGVAVALNAEDDVNLHFSDTIRAGHQLGREDAARVLVEEADRPPPPAMMAENACGIPSEPAADTSPSVPPAT